MLARSFTTDFETERLTLRRFTEADADSVFRNWASIPEIQQNYGEPVYATKEEVVSLLEKYIARYAEPNYYRWAIIEKASGECVGQIAYFLVDSKNEFAEIEYCVGTAFQKKGYATEACKAAIKYGFEKIGLHKVQICVRPSNTPSRKVIEKCGLTYEGTLRDYFKMPDGSFEGRMYFSVLQKECVSQE